MAQVSFNGEFQMGTSGTPTVLVDYTASVKSVKFTRNGETLDVTTFANNAKKYVKGLTDASLDIEFFASTAMITALQNLLGYTEGGASWQFGPEGTTAGQYKITQTGTLNTSTGVGLICESVDTPVEIGGVLMCSATFKVSGALTFGTY
jgi:hypothetical protein